MTASLSDLNTQGFFLDCKAVLAVNAATDYVYRASERGGTDTPVAGDLNISEDTRITAIRPVSNNVLRLNDNDVPEPLNLGTYFGEDGSGHDYNIYIWSPAVTLLTNVPNLFTISVADTLRSNTGSGFVEFDVSSVRGNNDTNRQLLNEFLRSDHLDGEQIVFAIGRPMALSDFDDSDLSVDFKALLGINRSGDYIYRTPDAPSAGTDTVIDGELNFGSSETPITAIRVYDNTGGIVDNPYPLVLNEANDDIRFADYFQEDGPGHDLTLYFQQLNDDQDDTILDTVLVSDTYDRGGLTYVNFELPAAIHGRLLGLVDGDRWIFAAARSSNPTTVEAYAGPDKSVASGETVAIGSQPTITNGVGDTTYAWTRVSGTGGSLSDATARRPRFTAPVLVAGTDNELITWLVTVTNNGVSDTDDVVVTVLAPDVVAPPPPPLAWGTIADQTDNVGDTVSVTAPATTGGDGTTVTYVATGLPSGVLFASSTRTFTGRPSAPGSYNVQVTATQGSESLAISFTWIIRSHVSSVAVSSNPLAGDTYGVGETIRIRVRFPNNVSTSASSIVVVIGSTNTTFQYESGTGSPDLVYSHVVTASESDTDGISITAGNLGGAITSGNVAVDLSHPALSAQASHKVDGTRAAPVAPSIPNTRALAGTAGSYQFPAITGNPLPVATISSALPDGVTFSNNTLSWSENVALGSHSITYRLTNVLGFSEVSFLLVVSSSIGARFTAQAHATAQVHVIPAGNRNGLQRIELGSADVSGNESITWLLDVPIDGALLTGNESSVLTQVTLDSSGTVSISLSNQLNDTFEVYEQAVQIHPPGITRLVLDPGDADQGDGYSWSGLGSTFTDFFNQLRTLDPLTLSRTLLVLDDGRRSVYAAFHASAHATAAVRVTTPSQPRIRARFTAQATESARVTVTPLLPPPVPRARLFRYAIQIPAAAGLPGWAWWNGRGNVILEGVEYQGSQFASSEHGVVPVSGIVSGDLADNHSVRVTFAATGLFRTWLLAGDSAGRRVNIYSLAWDRGEWKIVNRLEHTRMGVVTLNAGGTISVDMSAGPSDHALLPELLTAGSHQQELPSDGAFRWLARLADGYEINFP